MRFIIIVLALIASAALSIWLYTTQINNSDIGVAEPNGEQAAPDPSIDPDATGNAPDSLNTLLERSRNDDAGISDETLEAMASEAETYIAELQTELAYVNSFNARDHDQSITRISQALTQFGNWSVMVEIGANRRLSPDQEDVRQSFRQALGQTQSSAFPHLRASYGQLFMTTADLAGLETSAFGRGNGIVQFRNRLFRNERDLQNFHSHRRAMLVHLRFAQARYRWNETGDNFLSYDLDTPADNAVVMWADIVNHRPVR
jgi:hypothetical protein